MPTYLDANGNPAGATPPTYLDPNTGEPLVGHPTPALDLSNRQGQGVYQMSGPDGKTVPVPYGQVQQAAQQMGYKFANDADKFRFAKDNAADPNRVTSYAPAPGYVAPNESSLSAPMQVAAGVAKGAGTLMRPVADVIGAGTGLTPADITGALTANGPIQSLAKGATIGAGVVPSVISAPLTTAGATAAGYLGGKAGQAIGNAASMSPQNTQLLSDALGTGAGIAGGMGASALGDSVGLRMLKSPITETLNNPRGTGPAESATPAELKAYADQNGIPLNAAQATEHNFPRNLQSAGERATVGGTAVKAQTKAAQSAVIDHAQSLMAQFSPNTPDLATAGDKIQTSIADALDREKQAAQQQYAQLDKSANGVTVDLTPLKQQAADILKSSEFVRNNISSLDPKRASIVVKALTELPDQATFSQAQQLRSALLDEARNPDVVISQQGQGWIKKLSGAADQQMTQAASSNPELLQQFRDANANWEGIQNAFNNPRSPISQALQEPDPNKVPQKFMAKGQIGGSPYNAQLLDQYGIDKAPIKWAVMGDIMGKDFGLYNGGKTLAGYSDPFLRSVFSPGELDSIYKTGAIARSVKVNTNPSGTAVVEGAMADVQHPVRSMMPKAAAAKATNSPAFNDWLMNNPAPPSTKVAAFSKWINARRAALLAAATASNAGN